MTNTILRNDIYRNIIAPRHIRYLSKNSIESTQCLTNEITDDRVKRKFLNSSALIKKLYSPDDINDKCLFRIKDSIEEYSRHNDNRLIPALPMCKNRMRFKKASLQSKLELLFDKGNLYKGVTFKRSIKLRKCSDFLEISSHKLMKDSGSHMSAKSFESPVENDKYSVGECEYHETLPPPISISQVKTILPKFIHPKKRTRLRKLKKIKMYNSKQNECSRWDYDKEDIEFTNEALSIN